MDNSSLLRSWAAFHKFEEQLIASEAVDFPRNLSLADDLYDYARRLGKIPGLGPLEGVDVNIRMVKVFRSVYNSLTDLIIQKIVAGRPRGSSRRKDRYAQESGIRPRLRGEVAATI